MFRYIPNVHPNIKVIIANAILKKNKAGGTILHDCKIIAVRTIWYWYKDRVIDQRARINIPKINPDICGQLIF